MGKIYSESSVLIGYPSGQDGSTCTVYTLPAQDFLLSLDEKVFFGHIINPFTDKAYSFKMTVYWPHFCFAFKARVLASCQVFIVHSPLLVLMPQRKCTLFK